MFIKGMFQYRLVKSQHIKGGEGINEMFIKGLFQYRLVKSQHIKGREGIKEI
jgi:hypothetical protein